MERLATMDNSLFQCNECKKMTPIVRKVDKLDGGINHEYAECQLCGYKATYHYSDKKLRNLHFKLRNTKHQKKRQALMREVETYTNELNLKYGGGQA